MGLCFGNHGLHSSRALPVGLSAARGSPEQRSRQPAPLPFQGRHSSMAWTPPDCPEEEAYPTGCTLRGSDGITGEETVIKKCLFLCKAGILKALAKDTGRHFSSLGLREPFLLGGATAACGAGWDGKRSPRAREQWFPNTALALGWRVALITCVCVSFLRVIQHDAVRKQEQPLKHSGAFSLQGFWCWGRERSLTVALENVSAETLHVHPATPHCCAHLCHREPRTQPQVANIYLAADPRPAACEAVMSLAQLWCIPHSSCTAFTGFHSRHTRLASSLLQSKSSPADCCSPQPYISPQWSKQITDCQQGKKIY